MKQTERYFQPSFALNPTASIKSSFSEEAADAGQPHQTAIPLLFGRWQCMPLAGGNYFPDTARKLRWDIDSLDRLIRGGLSRKAVFLAKPPVKHQLELLNGSIAI